MLDKILTLVIVLSGLLLWATLFLGGAYLLVQGLRNREGDVAMGGAMIFLMVLIFTLACFLPPEFYR